MPQDPFAPPVSADAPPAYGTAPVGYGQPPAYATGPTLASPWLRLGGWALNLVLVVVTLGIGYLVWAMVLWSDGTNPGKKILGMKIISAESGQTLGWGEMLVRNFVFGGLVLGLLNLVTFSLISVVDGLMIFSSKNQRLIDRMAKTLVVMA